MSDPSCSVLLKAECALHFFTYISLWFFTSVQSAEWEQPPPHTNLVQTLLCWAQSLFWEAQSVKVYCVNPECRTYIQKTQHAQYSCLKKQCKTLNWFLRSTCPLEHLVLQLCSDSHPGHSFFSWLWVGSPAGPWLLVFRYLRKFLYSWVVVVGVEWNEHVNSSKWS